MTAHPLKKLAELGQSVWYDYIRRDLYEGEQKFVASFEQVVKAVEEKKRAVA